jgi:ssDNA-binding Zn-finger/Zn-ribbon topoisomerase 1
VLLSPKEGKRKTLRKADGPDVDPVAVECLQCGTTRVARRDRFKHFESPECPECGYLGWTPVLEVKAAEPRTSRERRRAARRLPSVA